MLDVNQLKTYRDAAAAAKHYRSDCYIDSLATAVDELAAEVEMLTNENDALRKNYEMAKRIIHSAGGLTRETLS